MRELYVKSLSGEEWPLSLYTVTRNCSVDNASRTIKVTVFQEDQNKQGYSQIQNKAYLVYDGDTYVIENVNETTVGKRVKKTISADHIFYQNMKLRNRIYETIIGTFTPKELLDFVLKGTGYKLVIDTTDLPTKIEVENFGNNNPLALLQDLVPNKLKGEFDYSNTEVIVAKQIGRITDKQLRHEFNVNSPSQEIDTTNLRTHIRGYGKQVEEQDILSGESKNMTWDSSVEWTRAVEPCFYTTLETPFKVEYTGMGVRFHYFSDNKGGLWEFTLDGDANKTQKVSTWSSSTTLVEKSVDLFRDAEQKAHVITAKYLGDDPEAKYPTETGFDAPRGYVRYATDGSQKTFDIYRLREGDEKYTIVTDYTSPLASVYGILIADPESDERFTDETSLKGHLEEILTDTIEISIKLTGVQLTEMDLSDVRKGDYLWCILDPFDIDVRIRVVDVEDYEDENKSPVFTLGAIKKKASTIMASLQQAAKNVDVIYDPVTKKVKSKAIDASTIEVNLAKAKGQLSQSQLSFSIPTYELASAVKDGLISAQDYVKLVNLNVGEDGNVDVPLASALNDGLMSAEFFRKLNLIQVDQNGKVIVDLTTIEQTLQQQEQAIQEQEEQITSLNERVTALENPSSP